MEVLAYAPWQRRAALGRILVGFLAVALLQGLVWEDGGIGERLLFLFFAALVALYLYMAGLGPFFARASEWYWSQTVFGWARGFTLGNAFRG